MAFINKSIRYLHFHDYTYQTTQFDNNIYLMYEGHPLYRQYMTNN